MPWYRTGTVAITAGQTTVTGTGTNFPANSRVGDAFQGPDGRWYEVTNIASATVISILPAYLGATVAAGTYGLAPMQGYVKESADRLRQLVDQFGATLSLFGGAATLPQLLLNIGAAARGSNSDITALSGLTTAITVAQGGTGGTTPATARAGLQLGSAAVAAIVGPVSQAAGVPTGAIIERGQNTNGQFVKYSDGTMIVWGSMITTSIAAGATTANTIPFPATFAAAASATAQITCEPYNNWDHYGVIGTTSMAVSQVAAFIRNGTSGAQQFILRFVVVGRWF
ncbi:phage tail protein [Pseudomonas putida]|uniref:Uncharacterized protein n=1 Tax=Pseudomonas putida TaxID=303 RepID=A0A2S3WEL5_PSEPU|nr:phage tail protein [Pseudomonas putida]POF89353.1 hypothetical protein BGP80_15855 [Pseudomonas putida]